MRNIATVSEAYTRRRFLEIVAIAGTSASLGAFAVDIRRETRPPKVVVVLESRFFHVETCSYTDNPNIIKLPEIEALAGGRVPCACAGGEEFPRAHNGKGQNPDQSTSRDGVSTVNQNMEKAERSGR